MRRNDFAARVVRKVLTEVNLSLPALMPMVFACDECLSPIWVPENYVAKPSLCPDCGGQWCRP